MNIFSLNAQFQRLEEALEDAGDSPSPELLAEISSAIAASKDAIEQTGFWRRSIKARIELCKERRAILAATIAKAELALDRIDAALLPVLEAQGTTRFPEFTMGVRRSELVAVAVAPGIPIQMIPDEFVRYEEPTLRKEAILAAVKGGRVLPEEIIIERTPTKSITQRSANQKKEE